MGKTISMKYVGGDGGGIAKFESNMVFNWCVDILRRRGGNIMTKFEQI